MQNKSTTITNDIPMMAKVTSSTMTAESFDDTRPSCDGYRILRTLGKGGHGVVKLVEKNGNEYAMKIFEPHPAEKQAFVDETLAELNLVKKH